MDSSQEMNHSSNIGLSPEALEYMEKSSNLEEIVQSLVPLHASVTPPSFSPAAHHDDAELRGRVRELEETLQRMTGAVREAESRAERAENHLATKLVDEARKDAENSELTLENDDLKRKLAEAEKKVDDTRNARRELTRTNRGLHEDNVVLVRKMVEGNEIKRVLSEENESLRQEMIEIKMMKRALADENKSLKQQLADMETANDRVSKWVREHQDCEEKKAKKPAHRGNSKKSNNSALISVKTLDPSKTALTEEERYGGEQEVVCEGCIWKKVDGEWRVVVGEKDEETKEEDANVEEMDEIDKMIEEMIKEKKNRIDSGIDTC